MLPQKIAFVDLETTGASTHYNRIIEVGIVRVENDVITQSFSSLVNPQAHIPPEIERITNISQRDVESAPTFREIASEIYSLLDGCIFVAHNVRFDYGFLKSEFARHLHSFTAKHFCTVRLSRLLYPEQQRHNLDTIIERFGFTCENRHRAFDDAKVIYEFYNRARRLFPTDVFERAVSIALKKPSLPPGLKKNMLDSLPENPGVYIMYGTDDAPLYVGKSINIKDRVLSHFTSDIHSATEMKISQQVTRLETVTTVGELGALFLESQLVKKLLPLYNRKLRIKRELIGLRKELDSNGYQTIKIESMQKIPPDDVLDGKIIGFFRSKKQAKSYLAKLAKEYQLCEKLLSLEKTNAACFAYRLGNCQGACSGQELPIKYNIRFLEAFSKLKIKPWPFPGPVSIEEKNEITGQSELFLIDKWCYMGSITYDAEGNSKKIPYESSEFDLDLYKILLSYLSTPTKLKHVRHLSSTDSNSIFSQIQ